MSKMTMFRVNIIVIPTLWLLAGCGGGTVSINQIESTNGKILPVKVLERLQKAVELSNDAEVDLILESLSGEAGDRLDWPKFWAEIGIRAFCSNLATRHADFLFRLHSKDCDSFSEFADFVLKVGLGHEYILGNKRQCQSRLNPSLALNLAEQVEANAKGSDRGEKLARVLQFLTREQQGGRVVAGWAQAFNDRDVWIMDKTHQRRIGC